MPGVPAHQHGVLQLVPALLLPAVPVGLEPGRGRVPALPAAHAPPLPPARGPVPRGAGPRLRQQAQAAVEPLPALGTRQALGQEGKEIHEMAPRWPLAVAARLGQRLSEEEVFEAAEKDLGGHT